jgi:hypothetical protein
MKRILVYPVLLVLGILVSKSSGKILNLADLDNTLINETLFSPLYNMSVEWGIYKPDLYFGVKNRQDKPLSMGMFWYSLDPNNETAPPNTSYPYVMD